MFPQMIGRRLLFTICVLAAASAQVRRKPELHADIRVDKDLVLVPVTVCDSYDRVITGLEKQHFRLFDNNVEQTVSHFSMEDEPLAIGLVFDTSSSMENKLSRSRLAASAFLETANPEDEFFLVEFNERPKVVVELTRDAEQIRNHLVFTRGKGRTALLDAIYLSLQQFKKSHTARKALLIISDGGDNASRYRPSEVRNLLRENGVIVYGIGVYQPFSAPANTQEELMGPSLLSEIAEPTGGREIPVTDLKDMPDVASKIGLELRNRYVLGFSPLDATHDGRYHRLHVKLVPPPQMPRLHAYWRPGYYAAGD